MTLVNTAVRTTETLSQRRDVTRTYGNDEAYDVLVVGAGGAGAPLAARLSENPRCSVLLLEAGPVPTEATNFPSELLNAGTVEGAAPDHPNNWSFKSNLMAGRPYTLARGRILGGSTSISGTYFIRGRKQDFDGWSSRDSDEWGWDRVLPFYRKLENDLQFGDAEGHGRRGPMIISRPPQDHPANQAFAEAARELGFPLEPDKNGQHSPGYGPMPTNSPRGLRINTGSAYISRALVRPNLTVRGGSYVRKVLFDGKRATGVEVLREGRVEVIRAREIVLAAGAIKTAHILLVSGLGPEAELGALGIPVIRNLPGVGKNFSDHPNIAVTWSSKTPIVDYGTPQSMGGVLNFTASGSNVIGDLEIIPLLKPMSYMLHGADQDSQDLAFLVSLQAATSRGDITLESSDPDAQPRIEFNYLSTRSDIERMRQAVRVAVRLLKSTAFRPLFHRLPDLADETVADDDLLDMWIRNHLGTAFHTCGTAKFGTPDDPEAVVDQFGRVYGVEGLRLADTSILPWAPTRGPAATAIMIGERIAHFMLNPESTPRRRHSGGIRSIRD
ncbi:mycofactocin system GMC family oxidoreductase MftG [Paenarthrobacter sp. YIM B13468]|uniref:mycofactocin dehydrogenase MftG n=1 Tax=Paenarthrobacter sp. YIM B13468 TaxID=3366295 RepID=UPI00366E49A9